MADIRFIVFAVLYIIWWPIRQILKSVVFLLTPLWTLASFILLPFAHLARTIFNIITFPFSVQWLDRIEARIDFTLQFEMLTLLQTVYIYLGTAALVGCLTGGVVFIIFKLLSSSLNIDSAPVPQPRDRSRTTTEYRAARREMKEESIEPMDYPPVSTPAVLDKVVGSRRKGLLSSAIIEEEDSDF
jgi:hypothetical protein